MRYVFALCTALLLAGAGSGSDGTADCDMYFVLVFGAQPPVIKSPRRSHTWAAFVHVRADGIAEEFTISWLPEAGRVRPNALHPEPGRNYGLQETVSYCRDHGMEMRAWGPYQIEPDLYHIAASQKEYFDSGAVQYKANDLGARNLRMCNCIHAVASMMREPGQRNPYVKTAPADWGESGSFWTALTLRPYFIEPCCVHYWVMERIGLCQGDFIAGYLDRNPTRDPATRVIQATVHRHLLPNRVKCPNER